MPDGTKVFRDIEQTAGLYGAATYTSLLGFFSDFVVEYEAPEYIPLTAVKVFREKDKILFAIGLIPPAANVTGRLLDRSASVLSVDGQEPEETASDAAAAAAAAAAGDAVNNGSPDAVSGTGGRAAGAHRNARQTLIDAFTEVMGRPPTTAELQYLQAIGWLETSYGNGWKGPMVGSNNWGAVHCPANAQDGKGCITYEDSHPNGKKFKVSFKSYETPKEGAKDLVRHVFKHRAQTAASLANGGPIFNASYAMRREKYYGGFCKDAAKQYGAEVNKSLRDPDGSDATKACAEEAITAHANLVKSLINDVAAANGDPFALGLGTYDAADAWWRNGHPPTNGGPVGGDANPANWVDNAAAAQNAAREEAKTGGTPLNATAVGQQFQRAQQAQIAATQAALQAMASLPPLKMLVNPSKFGVKGEKIVNDSSWSRTGPIVEHWGDGQDKISASGKVAGFYAIDVTNAVGPGLTRMARNFSESYSNFQALYSIYRNNGGLYLPDPLYNGVKMNLSHVGSVYIYYDATLYIGSFDSFNVTESDTAPFTLEYSFEFTVRAAFLLDRDDDDFNYGAPNLIPATSAPPTDPFSTPV